MMSENPTNFDSVLTLCKNQHRRIVLGALAEQQRSLTLEDLTEAILKYNHQMASTEAPEEILTDIAISLYHVHLPKLAAKGLITYDREHKLVEPTGQLDQVQPVLSTILDADPSLDAPMTL